MKVILLQDVDGLGKVGDLKDVANGYARNFLLPKKMAVTCPGPQIRSMRGAITARPSR